MTRNHFASLYALKMDVIIFSLFLSTLIFTGLVSAEAYADIPPTINLDKAIYPVPFGQLYNPNLPVGFTGDFKMPPSFVTSLKGLFPYNRDVTGNGLTVNPQNTLSSGEVMVHIRVNDQKFNSLLTGTDKLAVGVNDAKHGPIAVQVTRQGNSMLLAYTGGPTNQSGEILNLNGTAIPAINSSIVSFARDLGPMPEIVPGTGIFQADLPIRMTDGPQNVDCPYPNFWQPTDGTTGILESDRFYTVHYTTSNPFGGNYCVRQGDVLTVTYTFINRTSGLAQTISESSTFDLRNGTIYSDKSRYNFGSNMTLTLVEPDLNRDSKKAESIPLDLVEWQSYAFKGTIGQLSGQGLTFDAKPSTFVETGNDTGVFQTVIKIPKRLNNNLLEDGEKIKLEYTDWGPAGPIVGKNYHDADAIIYTTESNGTIHWTGNGDATYWSDPNNWSTHSLPTGKDYVVIDGNNKTSSKVHLDVNFTLDSGGHLVIQPGDTLVVDTGKMIYNNPLTANVSSTLSVEGTLDNNGLIVIKGSHQNVPATMFNEGLVNNNVGGSISITGGDAYIINNGKIINNNMINIHENSSDVGTFFAFLSNSDEIVNNGKIQFDNTPFFNSNLFSNFGSVVMNSGTFQSFGTFNNNPGGLFLQVNSSSNIRGPSSLLGSMNNSGNFTLAGVGTFDIGRSGFISNTGILNNEINNTIDNMGTINNLCGGIVNNDGIILDNPINQVPCPVVTLYSNKDSTIIQSANTTNFGSNGTLLVSQVGHKRSLVSFDLAPYETKQVSNAILRLYLTTDINSNNRVIKVHKLLSDWTEGNGMSKTNRGSGSGATWTCATDNNIANKVVDCLTIWNGGKYAGITDFKLIKHSMINQWIEFNVTNDVNSFLDGNPNDNFGWIIKKADESNNGSVGFASKENSDSTHAPQLVLNLK